MTEFLQDVRYAVRLFVKQPAFVCITVFVLALGIGATTAIFSVVNAVLLRPLPYGDPERLVSLSTYWRKTGLRGTVSAPDFHDWHDQSSSFEGLAAYSSYQSSVSVDNSGDYAVVTRATPEFLTLMHARAELGRLPTAEEQKEGSPLTALVSHAFWQSHLGGDRAAIGRTLKFREHAFTIVGVLTPEFRFPTNSDVWLMPWLVFPETPSRSAHNYRVVGRLKPGVSVTQAQSELDAIGGRLEAGYPLSNGGKGIAVDRLLDQMVRNVRATINLIFGVVAVVLLIACANVSNLLLARATVRTRELGIRAAIGASRTRIARQLLTEGVLLALVAGIAGVIVAAWGVRALVGIAPAGLPRLDEIAVNGRVLAFAAASSLTASLVFGVIPAWHASRVDLNELLKQGGRNPSAAGSNRMRAGLIVVETAAAVVLVIGAALLIRSFAALSRVDVGFPVDRLLVADTTVQAGDLAGSRRAVRFYETLLPQLAAMPGVESAAAVGGLPTQTRSNGGYVLEGGATFEQLGVRSPQAIFTVVTPKYFDTLGIRIVKGRDVADGDTETAPYVAVVNEALARKAFPGQDPIGRRLATGFDLAKGPDGTAFMTIVGVSADVRSSDPSLAPQPEIYMPYLQHPGPSAALTIVLRAAGDPMTLANPLVQRIRAANSEVPVKVTTMADTLGVSMSVPRFRTTLLALFAAVALVLAMAGIYGIVSFMVSQRTSELGLRMALGAQRSEIVRLTLAVGLRLTGVGALLGLVAAFAAARVLSSMLFETSARDPLIFVAVPVVLMVVATIASVAPAIRAARVDPAIALRSE